MTTIAWDGKTLAGDRAAWSGNHRYRTRKVYRVKRPNGKTWLVGFSGDGGFAMATLRWLRGGQRPGEYPGEKGKTLTIALIIDDRKRVCRLDSELNFQPSRGKPQATGGGQECAMGAMLAGATAVEAVRIVAKCTDLSAFGVDVVRF